MDEVDGGIRNKSFPVWIPVRWCDALKAGCDVRFVDVAGDVSDIFTVHVAPDVWEEDDASLKFGLRNVNVAQNVMHLTVCGMQIRKTRRKRFSTKGSELQLVV
eukprot:7318854-Prymnesium_polylepis.1